MMGPCKGIIHTERDGSRWASGFLDPNTYVESEVDTMARRLWERSVVRGIAMMVDPVAYADVIVKEWRNRFVRENLNAPANREEVKNDASV